MTEHGPSVRTRLVDQGFEPKWDQGGCRGYEERMIASPLKPLRPAPGCCPPRESNGQKDVFVSASGQTAGDALDGRIGIAGHRVRNEDIRFRWLYGSPSH
ncbi:MULTISPECIES: hypothetical protein [Bradyrhizobium]|jgi:hypothetical protein|uniref:hypothetical protein n=1 Tax=Bradyrhizobium TaxID=374 RepID=UPI0032DF2C1A